MHWVALMYVFILSMQTGTSPLLAAVYSQNLELVKLLINHNAHVDTVSSVSSSLLSAMVMIFFQQYYIFAFVLHLLSCRVYSHLFIWPVY